LIIIPGIVGFGRVGHYERKGLYAPDEVFPHISESSSAFVDFDGDPMRMSSPRYVLFNKSMICVRCEMEGIYFAKERAIYLDRSSGKYWPTSLHYHFNLYGRNKHGHETMLTKDHILPRAHGGKDDQSNYQTMCAPCNGRKRDRLPGETDEQYRDRRAVVKDVERRRNLLHTRGHYIPMERKVAE